MRLLLDTQIYLWWLANSRQLTRRTRDKIATAETVYVSAASLWEAAVKIGLGKLDARMDDLVAGIEASEFLELPIRASHAVTVSALPSHHRDPFDRMLVAQAVTEPLRLLTADQTLSMYSELVEVV